MSRFKSIYLVLVVVGCLLVYASFSFKSQPEPVVQKLDTQDQLARDTGTTLKGWLFMTLASKVHPDAGPQTFIYDLDDAHALLYPNLNDLNGEKTALNVFHATSPDGSFASFLGLPGSSLEQGIPLSRAMQVYRTRLSDVALQSKESFAESLAQAVAVSQVDGEKSIPQINNAGRLVYSIMGKVNENERYQEADTSHVYLVDENGIERFLMQGSNPRWVTDTQFVFIKNQGLFSYDITTDSTRLVLPQEFFGVEAVRGNVGLAASHDGRVIAISNPETSYLALYTVERWDAPVPEFVNSARVSGFWPQFSPDGSVLALQTVDALHVDTDPKPQVTFYKVNLQERNASETADKRLTPLPFSIDLNEFKQSEMFISDWAY